jgi:ribonuclease HI
LKAYCTNNQAEYKALLFGLELLSGMGVKHVKAFDDSQLVIQQVLGEYQCFDSTLNGYCRCLEPDRTPGVTPRGAFG